MVLPVEKPPRNGSRLIGKNCETCTKTSVCDPNCIRFKEIPFREIGGMVFEPGNSHGLVKLPPQSLINTLAEKIKQENGILIVNEITTGMGRTGAWFGFNHYQIQPDIIAIGKGLGNGYPISAIAMNRELAEQLERDQFRYAQSHQNDPLGCAVAHEVITVFREEEIIKKSIEAGIYFSQSLKQLTVNHQVIKELRARGLMIGMEFTPIKEINWAMVLQGGLLDRRFIVDSARRPIFCASIRR